MGGSCTQEVREFWRKRLEEIKEEISDLRSEIDNLRRLRSLIKEECIKLGNLPDRPFKEGELKKVRTLIETRKSLIVRLRSEERVLRGKLDALPNN